MPIYEYQGQQYDIATEDHAEAKTKILNYLGKQSAPTEATPAPATTEETPQLYGGMDVGSSAIMDVAEPKKSSCSKASKCQFPRLLLLAEA